MEASSLINETLPNRTTRFERVHHARHVPKQWGSNFLNSRGEVLYSELCIRPAAGFVGMGAVSKLPQGEESCTLQYSKPRGMHAMQRHFGQPDDSQIAANLRRAIELTELGLALRRSVLQQDEPQGDAMVQVMREIRRAKEQAWRQNRS